MVTANDVHDYITQAGPVLPKHVAEAFGISTLFASAFLSELSGSKKVLTSHLKIGGSPLYYTEDHKDRLVDYRGSLHEKEQKTFALLRSEHVLDDSKLELLDRVALRKMEDFAVPLAVDVGGERRIFWKYYLVSDDETARIIGELLGAERRETEVPEEREEPEEPEVIEPQAEVVEEQPQPARSEPEETAREPASEPDVVETAQPEKPKPRETQAKITVENVSHAPDAAEALRADAMGKKILSYFEEKGITLPYAEVIRKNTCMGVCSVPSPIGELDYCFYGKEKKTITDKDIKEAYAEAAILGYPLLYIAKGDVKKSATDLLANTIKGSIIIEL